MEVKVGDTVIGRCDDKCYSAQHDHCNCICGGKNHSHGYNKALENTREEGEEMFKDYFERFSIPENATKTYGMEIDQMSFEDFSTDNQELQRKPKLIHEDKRFTYPMPAGFKQPFCWIRVYELNNKFVVIATELKENPGMSVTNAVEIVASQVVAKLEIDPRKATFFEHYNYDGVSYDQRSELNEFAHSLDRVTFEIGPNGFKKGTWKHHGQSDTFEDLLNAAFIEQ